MGVTVRAVRRRRIAIVLGALAVAAVPTVLSIRHDDAAVDVATADSAIRIVDARTGQPVDDLRAAIPDEPRPAAASIAADRRGASLVQTLAARGAGDMPMLAEIVATQPRAPGDGAAEARAAQLLSGHLRLAADHPLQIRCAAAVCQVAGTMTSPANAIEAPALLESVLAAGWTPGPVASAPAGGGATDFLLFLNRES